MASDADIKQNMRQEVMMQKLFSFLIFPPGDIVTVTLKGKLKTFLFSGKQTNLRQWK